MSVDARRLLFEKVGPVRYGWWLFWCSIARPLHRSGDAYKGPRFRLYLALVTVAGLST